MLFRYAKNKKALFSFKNIKIEFFQPGKHSLFIKINKYISVINFHRQREVVFSADTPFILGTQTKLKIY